MLAKKLQSMGGLARAESLSPEKRADIAKRAASARWKALLDAGFEGELNLGTAVIDCAVIEKDKRVIRVISSAGFMTALRRPWKGTYKRTGRPQFLEAENLQPFITRELQDVLNLIEYRTKSGGVKRGYPAEIVPLVCEVYLAAREKGAIAKSQEQITQACEIIMRSLAKIGIVALVDEATGFQYAREKNALAKILEAYIAKELQPWTRTFPLEFYQQIFRLKKWPFDPATMQSPRVLAHYTNDIVYNRLAPGVLQSLREKNPLVNGKRKHKHFQWLTGEIGHPKLLAHLEGVKIIMRESRTWEELQEKLDRHYPIFEVTELGFAVPLKHTH
jgi:hypothetical protein